MRRNMWVGVVALATAGWLTACAGDAGETEDTAGDTTAQETPAPAPGNQQAGGTGGTPPEGATAEQVAQGQQIFTGKGNCFTCHGPQATGTPLAPNLTDAEWINISGRDYAEIQNVVRNGVPTPQQHPSPMPPMGGAQLSDAEIQSVAAYVYSIGQG